MEDAGPSTGGRTVDSETLCQVINTLQGQAFQINHDFFEYMLKEEDKFVDFCLLLPFIFKFAKGI